MKTRVAFLCIILCVLFGLGLAAPPQAAAQSGSIEIKVLCDRGTPAEEHKKSTEELAKWMEKDLVNRLTRAGYSAELITSKDQFVPAEGRYLLTVTVVKYNPGSSAARIVVGFGAGSASLDNHYDLIGAGGQPVLSWDDGVGTSGHWSKLPAKLNGNAVNKIKAQLGK